MSIAAGVGQGLAWGKCQQLVEGGEHQEHRSSGQDGGDEHNRHDHCDDSDDGISSRVEGE